MRAPSVSSETDRAGAPPAPPAPPAPGESPSPGAGEAAPPDGAERRLLAAVALATVLAPLNSTMIAVAMPSIMADLGATAGDAAWLVTGYLVAMAALQPLSGKLGDRFGRRWLVLGGLASFGLASAGAAVSGGLVGLVICRVLQGVAGAVALPNAAALIREVVPPQRRASRLGLVGAAVALAAAGGPPLGGLLAGAGGWRALFVANLPFVLVALALAWFGLPRLARKPHRTAAGGPAAAPAFDVTGALLLTVLLVGPIALVGRGLPAVAPAAGPVVLLAVVAALVALAVLFVVHELRHVDPVVQLRLFGRRAFAAANAAVALGNLAMYVTLLAVPLLLAIRPGWTSTQTGLVLAALSAAMVVCAPLGGRLADRYGRRRPVVAGHLLLALGLAPLPLAGSAIAVPVLLAGLGLAGLGLGLAQAGLQTAALESVPREAAGAAAGLFSTSRYLGSITGTSAMGALLATTAVAGAAGTPTPEAFRAVFVMVVVAAMLAAISAGGLPGGSVHSQP